MKVSRRAKPTTPTRRAARLAVLTASALLAGCGESHGGRPARTPASNDAGRPIGGRSTAGAQAIATSVRFARGYLALQAGQLAPDRVPATTPELRRALRRLRIPPAAQDRQTTIVRAELERIDGRSARVTVHVRNLDERLTYPLPVDLVRRDSLWAVLSAGDDT